MVYLDNAATSFPKPVRVVREQTRCMRSYCGNAGRGSHALSLAAAEKIYECRTALSSFFGASGAEQIVFTMNTTHALNTVIKGVLREGDHVLLSDMEHNAVLRPIAKLEACRRISYSVFPTFPTDPARTDEAIIASIMERIRPNTRLLVCAHASNICSATLPIEQIGELCRRHGILFCVDAAQSAGHLPIDIQRMKIDFLCAPAHKGLFGAQGVGILALGSNVECDTLTEGGSGYRSHDLSMPEEPPERYEAGTLPTPAISALLEGVKEVRERGLESIQTHERVLVARLSERLKSLYGITQYASHHTGGLLLFSHEKLPSDSLAEELNRRGFCVRAGLHCSPLAHATLSTPEDGAVRVSPSIFNTLSQMDAFADALAEIIRATQ